MRTLKSFTEEELRKFLQTEDRRLELDRESRQIKDANEILLKDLKEAFLAEGKITTKRGAIVAVLEQARDQVAWKEAFLRECGADKAASVAAAAGTKPKARIRPA